MRGAARPARRRPAARARPRRPALERPGVDRPDRGAAAPRPERARPARARLPPRPGARAARRRACRAGRAAHRARAAQRERRRGSCVGDGRRRRRSTARGGRQPVLPRAARARRAQRCRRRRGRRRRRHPRRRRGVARRGARRRWPSASARCCTAPPSPGEPFEPDLAAAVGELSLDEGLAALDALLARDLAAADRPSRAASASAIRSCAARSTTRPRPAGGCARTPARRSALAARGAAPTELAHHVERSAAHGRRGGDRDCCSRPAPTAAPRAPAAAARWFEAALRAAARRRRRAPGRAARRRSPRRSGRWRPRGAAATTLLEAMELLPADAGTRRVELTALCAAVEHWLGRHADAHRRLVARLGRAARPRRAPRPPRCRSSWPSTASTRWTSTQTIERGRGALELARAVGDRALIAAAASALCLGEAAAGRDRGGARAPRRGARPRSTALSDAELAPRLEALYYLGWAENYLEHCDEAVAHVDRGIAIARATGEGRLLVPMMLVKGYPFELQRPPGRGDRGRREAAVEASRLSRQRPLPLLVALRARLRALPRRQPRRGDRRRRGERAGRPAAGRRHDARRRAADRAGSWRCARFEAGEVAAGVGDHARARRRRARAQDPRRALLRLGDPGARRARARATRRPPRATSRRAEELAAELGLHLPAALALRGARGGPARRRRARRRPPPRREEAAVEAEAAGARLLAAFARALAGRGARRRPASARQAIADAARRRVASSTSAARVRVRDEMRRELRKLGARAEKRGPAAAGDSGVAALTKREREIAELVTDRQTNREIAAELFLSDKTIESHLRNIFVKLGVSSRVEVARAVERERERRRDRCVAAAASTPTPRGSRELGYPQELARRLRVPRQRRDGLRRDLAGRRPLRRRLRRHRRRRARRGSGCCRSRSPGSACCSRSTPSWPRSSRSPAAPTSGAAG